MSFLLNIADPVTFSDKLLYGGQMLLIGMGAVFMVLAILWGCLELMRVFFYDLPNKKKNGGVSPSPVKPAPVKKKEKVEAALSMPVSSEEAASADDEIVAVIAAAIAMAEADHPAFKFRAVSFKRIK